MDALERAAMLLIEAHSSGRLCDARDEAGPRTLEDAYRIQDLVLRALCPAECVRAWKAIPPRPVGAAPAATPVPPAALLRSPALVPCAGLTLVGVEAEIAFEIDRDLPPRPARYEEAEIADAVRGAFVLLELCATRLKNWRDASALWKLADFQSNGRLVVGSGVARWQSIDFASQEAELFIDGLRRASAVGSHPVGNPFRLLPSLVEHCKSRGGLRSGDIVTTGSWTGLTPVETPATILARFPGIGEATLRLES